MFKNLGRKGVISENELEYFFFEYKKATNVGKLYLLPKIHNSLKNVLGRPVTSNCRKPTGKVSEFFDDHLKPVMQNGWPYIKDSGGSLKQIRNMGNISQNVVLVTADVVGLYPNIPHNGDLKTLSNMLEAREDKTVPTNDLIKMARFVLETTILNLMVVLKNKF